VTPHAPPSAGEPTAEPVLRSRLLPQVSFQSLLLLMTLSAVVIAVVYAADQGGQYATAVAAGLAFLVAVTVVSLAVFLLSWAVSYLPKAAGVCAILLAALLLTLRLTGVPPTAFGPLLQTVWLLNLFILGGFLLFAPIGREPQGGPASPFADGQLPPQIFAPRDPND
jgi:hypothetical protein